MISDELGLASFRPVQDHLGALLRDHLDAALGASLPEPLAALAGDLERRLGEHLRQLEPGLREQLLAVVPKLRAFAISLGGRSDAADDLVQETLLRALRHLDRFERGTNLEAWLFTILRNQFHTEWRRRSREVEDPNETYAHRVATIPDQIDHLTVGDLRSALTRISAEQREALLLIAVEGLSYEEAARICGVATGTIKSRVNRARERLAKQLDLAEAGDFGADHVTRAVTG